MPAADARPNAAPRAAPFRPVPDHDASLLRLLFRGGRFPDTEWWSHGLFLVVVGDDGERRELSLFVNVQLLAEPFRGEVAPAAVVAIRDVHSGERFVLRSRGTMGSSRACRYSSPGWLLFRLDPEAPTFDADALGVGLDPDEARRRHTKGAYVVSVDADGISLSLVLGQEKWATLGNSGWVDYNPDGEVPLWTSAKVRTSAVEGSLTLPVGAKRKTYAVESGHAHSEQQCIVPSASMAPLVSRLFSPNYGLETLLEALLQRPRWHWFRARLAGGVDLTAHCVWNPRTGTSYRDHATLLGPDGEALDARGFTCSAPKDDGTAPIPSTVTLAFEVPVGVAWMAAGAYEVVFRHGDDVDWSVPFALPLGRVCVASEAHCTVEVRHAGRLIAETVGGHETIDLVSSIVQDE